MLDKTHQQETNVIKNSPFKQLYWENNSLCCQNRLFNFDNFGDLYIMYIIRRRNDGRTKRLRVKNEFLLLEFAIQNAKYWGKNPFSGFSILPDWSHGFLAVKYAKHVQLSRLVEVKSGSCTKCNFCHA